MIKKKLILFGAGGHSKSCIDVINLENKFKIVSLVDKVKKKLLNYKIIQYKNLSNNYKKRLFGLVSVGQIKTPKLRIKLYNDLKKLNLIPATIISPTAVISKNSKIGSGTIIMHNVVINSNATIGDNCIINTGAIIEHDVKIEDHCHVAPRATINGNVKVKIGSFVGSGAIIKQNIILKESSVIPMGSKVKKNN